MVDAGFRIEPIRNADGSVHTDCKRPWLVIRNSNGALAARCSTYESAVRALARVVVRSNKPGVAA